jgi:peptide deformylase
MKLSVAYYDDPILRQKAAPITEVTPEIRQLAFDMIKTMDVHRGIGLAAPQVKQPIRMFVARLNDDNVPYEEWLKFPVEVFINPVLSEHGGPVDSEWEACLSLPGIKGKVERPTRVRLQAMDLEGRYIERVYEGYLARVLQHETDHLDGILYIDRMSKAGRKQLEPSLKEIKKKYH